MFCFVLLAALVPPIPEPVAPVAPAVLGGAPPTQMLASIDADGQLRLLFVAPSACDGPGREYSVPVPGGAGAKKAARTTVKVNTLVVTTAELAAKHATGYTTDGRPIDADKLATLLAKERTVLVALDGKKVDPFLLQLYKDDTIVLVLPANALPAGPAAVGAYGMPDVVPILVPPVPPVPLPAPIPERRPGR